MSHDDDEARDRAAIQARRLRFVKLALAGATMATVQASCHPCLNPAVDSGPRDAAVDSGGGGEDGGTAADAGTGGDDGGTADAGTGGDAGSP